MKMHAVVLTLMGPDRPGLVEAVSACVAAHGGNWEESRMAHLGGQFAGLLRVTLAADRQAELETALRELGSHGLTVHSTRDLTPEPAPPGRGKRLQLEVTGQDREGIVRDIAKALAGQAINVEELASSCASAPMTGEPIFHARALLWVPVGASEATLREELEAIGDDLMVDIRLADPD